MMIWKFVYESFPVTRPTWKLWQISLKNTTSLPLLWNRQACIGFHPFELLESRGFKVYLVDARHVKNVTDRKSDVENCRWIQKLHSCGLLSAAFRSDGKILPLHSYTRQRDTLVEGAENCIRNMQKALTQMTLHLSNVLNDIAGLTGMTIIRSIVAGERDPKKLAQFCDKRCKQPLDIIEKSLTGNY